MLRWAHGQEWSAHPVFRLSNRGIPVTTAVLDAKGLSCPLPILKAKKALQGVPAGGLLEIYATDPGAEKDFEAFCRATRNELVASSREGNVFKFVIKRLN
jgi:tRNA 2-thiouridine synthesizing protein A